MDGWADGYGCCFCDERLELCTTNYIVLFLVFFEEIEVRLFYIYMYNCTPYMLSIYTEPGITKNSILVLYIPCNDQSFFPSPYPPPLPITAVPLAAE